MVILYPGGEEERQDQGAAEGQAGEGGAEGQEQGEQGFKKYSPGIQCFGSGSAWNRIMEDLLNVDAQIPVTGSTYADPDQEEKQK